MNQVLSLLLCALSLCSMVIPRIQAQIQSSDLETLTWYHMSDINIMSSPYRFPTAFLSNCVSCNQIDSCCDWNEELIEIVWDSNSWVSPSHTFNTITVYLDAYAYPIDSGLQFNRFQVAEQNPPIMANHSDYGMPISHGIKDVFLDVLSFVWVALHGSNSMMYSPVILFALFNNAKGQTYFTTSTTTTDWFTARETCQSNGGDLAIISTEAEQDAVASFLASGATRYFIGTFQIGIDGAGTNADSHMYHIDGTEMDDSFVHWNNPTIKEYFATDVTYSATHTLLWRHCLIDNNFKGLCQTGLASYNYPMIWNQLLPGMSGSSTASGATKIDSSNGNYFLLDYDSTEAPTRHAANQYCLARGGLGLAYISTSALNTEAVDLCKQKAPSTVGCWIGLSTWNSKWHWVDGTSTTTLPSSISDRPIPLTIYVEQMSYHVYPPTSRWYPVADIENRVGICQSVPPTSSPTQIPTTNPTKNPTFNPTRNPTSNPTEIPSKNPLIGTANPTKSTTVNPTLFPTKYPTRGPVIDTINPTKYPTSNPTTNPTQGTTANPTLFPTKYPTRGPLIDTTNPTKYPTSNPFIGTENPTKGTGNPTLFPTVIDNTDVGVEIEKPSPPIITAKPVCVTIIAIPALIILVYMIFLILFICRSTIGDGVEASQTKETIFGFLHLVIAVVDPILFTIYEDESTKGLLIVAFGLIQIVFHFVRHRMSSELRSKSSILFNCISSAIYNILQGSALLVGVPYDKTGSALLVIVSWVGFVGDDIFVELVMFFENIPKRFGAILVFIIGFIQTGCGIFLFVRFLFDDTDIALSSSILCDAAAEFILIGIAAQCLYFIAGLFVFCWFFVCSCGSDRGAYGGVNQSIKMTHVSDTSTQFNK
eukprot:76218_1